MTSAYDKGMAEGLKLAATLCDETASTLDRAWRECEEQGEALVSELVGAGAIYVRHTAAKIRAVAEDQRG